MAEIIDTTSYNGKVAGGVFYALMQGDNFSWGPYVHTYFNQDAKDFVLPSAAHDANPLQENKASLLTADLVPRQGSNVTFKERKLSVKKMMYQGSLDPEKWLGYFPEFQPDGTALDLKMNPKVLNLVLKLATNAIQSQITRLHTAGVKGGADKTLAFYDGFKTLIKADADTTIVGEPAVLSATNILDRVNELKKSIPARLAFNPKLFAFCSKEAFELYHEARAKSQTYIPNVDLTASPKLKMAYGSTITLVPIEAMPRDFMFATIASTSIESNLCQGFYAKGDDTTIKVGKLTPSDEVYYTLLRMYTGVQYRSGKDIFFIDKDAK